MITDLPVKSGFPYVAWPAIPAEYDAMLLALQFQLERTQWLPESTLAELQLAQANGLLKHAIQTVPYYQQSLSEVFNHHPNGLSWDGWRKIPILKREDLQRYSNELSSNATPTSHLPLSSGMTSGSTGRSVSYMKTAVTNAMHHAITMRDHIWHQRDLNQKLAIIKSFAGDFARYGNAAKQQGWGVSTNMFEAAGESVALSILTPVESQLEWLIQERPAYILSYPSNLAALAELCINKNIKLEGLVEVTSYAEKLSLHQRELCKKAWGLDLIDMYSASEVGYLALQCPTNQHFHVQAEHVILEVLDDNDNPCQVGQVGRLIVTTLNNFAKPLIRYEIGDHAEVGEPCACGRSLPVLKNIMGRTRNMFYHPNGQLFWPGMAQYSPDFLAKLPAVRQFQFVQKAIDWIELRIAIEQKKLPDSVEQEIAEGIRRRYQADYRVTFSYAKELSMGLNGKCEEFICEVKKPS